VFPVDCNLATKPKVFKVWRSLCLVKGSCCLRDREECFRS